MQQSISKRFASQRAVLHHFAFLLSPCLFVCLALTACQNKSTPQKTENVSGDVQSYLACDDDARAELLLASVLAGQPSFDSLQAAVHAGMQYDDSYQQALQWHEEFGSWHLEYDNADGSKRWLTILLPPDYNPAQKHILVIHLHSAMKYDAAIMDKLQMNGWRDRCATKGWIAMTVSEGGGEWSSDAVAHAVMDGLLHARRYFNIDEDRTFLTGFDQGGGGVWTLAQGAPFQFAGMIPVATTPQLVDANASALSILNLRHANLYALNGSRDHYSANRDFNIYYDTVKRHLPNAKWTVILGAGHDDTLLKGESVNLITWMDTQQRASLPATIDWTCSPGSQWPDASWIHVDLVTPAAQSAEFESVSTPRLTPLLGINLYQDRGNGLQVSKVAKGSAAQTAGLRRDDYIAGFNGQQILSMNDLRKAINDLPNDNKAVPLTYRNRYGTFEAKIHLKARPTFHMPEGSARLQARVENNIVTVKCSQVRAMTIKISPALFDLTQPIVVIVNGHTLHDAMVNPDPRYLLRDARKRLDRGIEYCAEISLQLP